MRELSFTLAYDPGCNAVADTLAAQPEARIRSLSLHVTPESLWRVDHATGSTAALAAIEEAFLTSEYYADCLATDHCGATQRTQVLEHDVDTLVLYSYWERTPACASVPHIALDHLGDGALFETRHEGRDYTWRIIHADSGDVRGFFDAVETAVGDCAVMTIERLTEANPPRSEGTATANALPEEQVTALRAAVEHGYYEIPRAIDTEELADRLDVPRSTLAYRLRRAESYLAESYAAKTESVDGLTTPPSG